MMAAETFSRRIPTYKRFGVAAVGLTAAVAVPASYVKGQMDADQEKAQVAEAFQEPGVYREIQKREDEAIDTIPAARIMIGRSIDRADAEAMAETIAKPEDAGRLTTIILKQSEGEPGPIAIPTQFVDHEAVNIVTTQHSVIPTIKPQ